MPDESRAAASPVGRRRRASGGLPRAGRAGPVSIRQAGPADLSALVRLRVALAREEAATGTASRIGARNTDGLRGLTERQLREPNAVIFLAVASQREIGILRCADPDCHEPGDRSALVTTVFVSRSHRRRGVLRALLRQAEEWCAARGVASLRLRVGAGNALGQAAWSSLGFEAHAILMSRPVNRD